MRVPGWLIAMAILVWIGGTAACGGVSFFLTQNFVVQAGADFPLPDLPSRSNRPTAQPTAIAQAPTETPLVPDTPIAGDNNTAALAPTEEEAPAPADMAAVADDIPTDDNVLVSAALGRLGPRKITILLLGIDQRSAVESADTEYFRTDTIIVLQLDPVRRTAGMLSVPRDLYVDIPGFTTQRINTANLLGDANGYPGGGPALAMQTIEDVLGLDVDNYVLVNFDVFTTIVDTVAPNGVEVCVQEPIYDPKYPDEGYGFIEVRFETGCQMLDSERLLQFARTRATQGSDFDRARRQQQVITAVQRQVTSAGGLATLVVQAPAVWTQLSGNLRTDLTFERALDIALVASTIDRDNIQTGVIDNLYVNFAKDEEGNDILVPIPSAISALIQDTFNTQGDLTRDDLRERAANENASIIVLNNTDIAGLAGTTRDWLSGQGVSVATVGNTQSPNGADTIIRDYTGNPWTARYLADVLGLPRERILSGTDGQTSQDIALIIGPDIQTLIGQ